MIVTEWEQVKLLCQQIHSLRPDEWVAIDTETSSPFAGEKLAEVKPYAGAYVMGFSVAFRNTEHLVSAYIPLAHRVGPNCRSDWAEGVLHALAETDAWHVLHNCQFDWAILENYSRAFRRSFRTIDTGILQWLKDENQRRALKEMAAKYLGADAKAEQTALKDAMVSPWNSTTAYKAVRAAFPELPVKEARRMGNRMAQNRSWGDLDSREIADYASKDTELTGQLAEYFLGRPFEVPDHVLREMELNHLTYEMTRRGIRMCPAQLASSHFLYESRRAKLHEELCEELVLCPGISHTPTKDEKRPNPSSSTQIGKLLYGRYALPILLRTPGGDPSTSKNALDMLQGHEIAAKVLDYRRWDKATSAYTSSLQDYLAKSPDGRIHTGFNTTGTVTGRLSASLPNLMQIPKGDKLPELRAAFIPADGMELWEFDIVSAELYVTAAITKDPLLTAQLTEGRDMHTETALAMFGKADGRWRTLAKNVNYGSAYEAGPTTLSIYAAKAGLEPGAAKRMGFKMADDHRRIYARMHHVADKLAEIAKREGKLPHKGHTGRYRHFRSPGQDIAFYTALNAMVQGGIGEFVKDVMLEVGRTFYRNYLLLQIHDALVFELEPGMAEQLGLFLNAVSEEVNVWSMPLRWEAKQWAVTSTT